MHRRVPREGSNVIQLRDGVLAHLVSQLGDGAGLAAAGLSRDVDGIEEEEGPLRRFEGQEQFLQRG